MKVVLLVVLFFASCLAYAKDSSSSKNNKNLTALAFKNLSAGQSIVFVHGTPGSSEAFSYYINDKQLRSKSSMISVDRIGFGKDKAPAEQKLAVHSQAVFHTAQNVLGRKKLICVGHSYGATLCLDMIARYAEHFEHAVLIAGAFNPNRKILRWYNHLAAAWPLRSLLSKFLMNSNKEMFGLKKELRVLESKFDKIVTPVTIVHGKKDRIVPYDDAVWLFEKLKEKNKAVNLSTYKKAGHFILWKQQEQIKKELLQLL